MEFLAATKAGSIMGPIATVFGYIMDWLFIITSNFGIMNIGLCIILFTVITKILLLPLTIKQQKSSKLMSLMNPEIKAVQKKYQGKTDQTSMAKQKMEMEAIYEKYGCNPTAGCLPMLIQLPIILALYRVIYNIPAYVPSVRVFFDNVAEPLSKQPDFINKIAELANIAKLPVDKFDYTDLDKIVDLLYKFTPDNWKTLENTFPQMADVIIENGTKIIEMNSFFGIDLASAPFTGFTTITIAWVIPILAGVTQWISTKMITNMQPQQDQDAPGAQMMNGMMVTMPLMSVFFCFTLPAALGVYWVVQGVIQIFQQLFVNSYMNKVDIDDLIRKNVEKMNKKRAKKGLPPARVNQNAAVNLKTIKANEEKAERAEAEKRSKRDAQMKESIDFYNSDPKPGSLAAKAKMVQKYNEKTMKK